MDILVNNTSELTETLMDDFIAAATDCVEREREDTGLKILDPDRIEISRGALKKAVADLSATGTRPWEGFPDECLSVRREKVVLPRIGTR